MFRPEDLAELTTPSAPFSERTHFVNGAATPPLRGGEYVRQRNPKREINRRRHEEDIDDTVYQKHGKDERPGFHTPAQCSQHQGKGSQSQNPASCQDLEI